MSEATEPNQPASQTIAVIDAFTDKPFAGNPAAVCLLVDARSESWMRDVAAELNLSETAFVVPRADGAFDLRWFTPSVEIDLCGHATLASAHWLWEMGVLDAAAPARFETRSGLLTCRRVADGIEMDFPLTTLAPLRGAAADLVEDLTDALGAAPRGAWRAGPDVLIELDDEATVRGLAPDISRLRSLDVRGIIVTAGASSESASAGIDFVSRFFAPGAGIDEDPVTGSAHCALGPFWAARLHRDELTGFQVSRRRGVVHVVVDAARGRVLLRGRAVTVWRGELIGRAAAAGA